MTLALAALRELNALAEAMRHKPALPDVPGCLRQADERPPLAAPQTRPDQHVLEGLRRNLQHACASTGAASIPPRMLRQAHLVFWHGTPQAVSFPGLYDAFMHAAAKRASWLRHLVEAWLRDFNPGHPRLAEAGRAISALLPRAEHPGLRVWHDAQLSYQLFDAAEGPRRVARGLLLGPEDAAVVLRRTGMDDPLRADGGFYRAALRAMLAELPAALRRPTGVSAWARAMPLLETDRTVRPSPGNTMRRTSLTHGDLSGEIARACLGPWLDGSPAGAAPRKEIEAFLLRNLGDPRVETRQWMPAGEAATKLMRSWLAEASLEAFLSLISQTNDDRQWYYRQAFWRACLRKMPTAEVWVVLGPGLAGRAAAVRDLQDTFGRLDGGGAAADQAVLLMRLGNLVLSEWSNVGPVRAWDVSDRACPRLYKPTRYTVDELRAPSLDFPPHPLRGRGGSADGRGLWHRSGDQGLWQGSAAALLNHRLQLRLSEADYMPR
jgi:hypothetical protein